MKKYKNVYTVSTPMTDALKTISAKQKRQSTSSVQNSKLDLPQQSVSFVPEQVANLDNEDNSLNDNNNIVRHVSMIRVSANNNNNNNNVDTESDFKKGTFTKDDVWKVTQVIAPLDDESGENNEERSADNKVAKKIAKTNSQGRAKISHGHS